MLSKIHIEIEGEQAELLQYLEQLQKLPRPASIKWKSEKPKQLLTHEQIMALNPNERSRYLEEQGGWLAIGQEYGTLLSDDTANALIAIKQARRNQTVE